MKNLLILALLGVSLNVMAHSHGHGHGHCGAHSTAQASDVADRGHHAGNENDPSNSPASPSMAAVSSQSQDNGSALIDDYQPWPEIEMSQFAKSKFLPYEGK